MQSKRVKVMAKSVANRKWRPYCSWNFGDDTLTRVAYLKVAPYKSRVRFEKPDNKFGAKVMECVVPDGTILQNVGFTQLEVMDMLAYAKDNIVGFLEEW